MRRIVGAIIGAVAIVVVLAPTVQATNGCPGGTIGPGATVNDNVQVAAGASCTIVSSTVTGSVTVGPGGSLDLVNSAVGGSLTATSAADVDTEGGSVGGSVLIDGSSSGGDGFFDLCGTDVGLNVTIQNVDDADVAFGDDDEGGECSGPESMARVGGSLLITGNSRDIDVEAPSSSRNLVGGGLTVNANTGEVDIKNSVFNREGNVTDNTTVADGIELSNNRFGRTLSCTNNDPDPTGGGNQAPAKTGECAAL